MKNNDNHVKKNTSLLLFLIGFFLYSCKNGQVDSEKIQVSTIEFTNQVNVSYQEIVTDYLLSYPMNIILTDSFFIIQDERGHPYYYHAINKNSGLLAFEFGQKGNGPEDILSTTFNPFYNISEGEIQFFDPNKRSLCYYKMNEKKMICKNMQNDISQKYNLFLGQLFHVDNFYLATGTKGAFDESRFVVFDENLQLINTLNKYPVFEGNMRKNEKLLDELLNIYFFRISPNKKNAVFASYKVGFLEIFSLNELPEKMVKIKSLLLTQVMKNEKENIYGFEDVFVTDNFIYTLHNGKTAEENPYLCKSIKIFDWNGNPVVEYNVGVDMKCIAVDENKKIIYSVAYTDEDGFFLMQIRDIC